MIIMKILSFDVGIKNLAYCQLDSETNSILDWGILNISVATGANSSFPKLLP